MSREWSRLVQAQDASDDELPKLKEAMENTDAKDQEHRLAGTARSCRHSAAVPGAADRQLRSLEGTAAPFLSYADERLEAIVADMSSSQGVDMPIRSATNAGFAVARTIAQANLAALRRWCCQAARWRRLVAHK